MLLQATNTEKAILRALVAEEGASLNAEEVSNVAFHQSGVTDAEPVVRELARQGWLSDRLRPGRYVLTPVGRWAAGQLGLEVTS